MFDSVLHKYYFNDLQKTLMIYKRFTELFFKLFIILVF